MNRAKQITEPFAVRLNPKIKIELEDLIREYKNKGTQGEFIELLIETFKANELSSGISNTEADLSELNTLTTRIYDLYSNLIEKSNTNIDIFRSKMYEEIEDKDILIIELEEIIEELKNENHIQSEEILESSQSNEKLSTQIEDLTKQVSLDNNPMDKTNEEVEDIKRLREEHKNDIEKIRALEAALDSMTNINKELEYKLDAINIEHQREIRILENDLEAKNIRDLWKVKEEYQKEIKGLQDKNFKDREQMLDKFSKHLVNI